jgi:hypothetical protein
MVVNVDLVKKVLDAQYDCALHQAIVGERVVDITLAGNF